MEYPVIIHSIEERTIEVEAIRVGNSLLFTKQQDNVYLQQKHVEILNPMFVYKIVCENII